MSSQAELAAIAQACVREYAAQSGRAIQIGDQSPLIGPESSIDSLGLVMVVTAFEAKVNEQFGAAIVLASEAAMSMRRSPFRSVQALAEYADQLLREAGRA